VFGPQRNVMMMDDTLLVIGEGTHRYCAYDGQSIINNVRRLIEISFFISAFS
jgi:hypothetical protein